MIGFADESGNGEPFSAPSPGAEISELAREPANNAAAIDELDKPRVQSTSSTNPAVDPASTLARQALKSARFRPSAADRAPRRPRRPP